MPTFRKPGLIVPPAESGLIVPPAESFAPTRRGFLAGLAAVVAAPAIVRADSLMPVKVMEPAPLRIGLFVESIMVDNGLTAEIVASCVEAFEPHFRLGRTRYTFQVPLTDPLARAADLAVRAGDRIVLEISSSVIPPGLRKVERELVDVPYWHDDPPPHF